MGLLNVSLTRLFFNETYILFSGSQLGLTFASTGHPTFRRSQNGGRYHLYLIGYSSFLVMPHKLPQCSSLRNTTEVYPLAVLEARRLKSRCRALPLLQALEKNPCLFLAVGGCQQSWHSLADSCISPTSGSVFTGPSFFCVCLSLYPNLSRFFHKDHSHWVKGLS